jgi:hypothetical protein
MSEESLTGRLASGLGAILTAGFLGWRAVDCSHHGSKGNCAVVERDDEPGVVAQGHEVYMRLGLAASPTEIQSALRGQFDHPDDLVQTLGVQATTHPCPSSSATGAG